MKRLLKLIKNNNLDLHVSYYEESNQYRISAGQGRTSVHFMNDAFDVARSYTNRELEDVMVDYICSNLRLDKEDEY